VTFKKIDFVAYNIVGTTASISKSRNVFDVMNRILGLPHTISNPQHA